MNAPEVINFDIEKPSYRIYKEDFSLNTPTLTATKKVMNSLKRIEELGLGDKKGKTKGKSVEVSEIYEILSETKEDDSLFGKLVDILLDMQKAMLSGKTEIFNRENFRIDFFNRVLNDFFISYTGQTRPV